MGLKHQDSGLLQTSLSEVARAVEQVLRMNLSDDNVSAVKLTDVSRGTPLTTSKETGILTSGNKGLREEESVNPGSKSFDFSSGRNIVDSHSNFESWLSSFLPTLISNGERESSMGVMAEGEQALEMHSQQRNKDSSDPPWTGDIINWKQ